MDTRIWICPALCGCEIELTADWVNDPETDSLGRTVSHMHPKGFTITAMAIINICASHVSFTSDPLPQDPYGGAPGYIRVPQNPTPEEKLYIQLYQFSGVVWKPDSCGCSIYQTHNRFIDDAKFVNHPVHTSHCKHHTNDFDHSEVVKEVSEKELVKSHLREIYRLSDEDIAWAYENDRSLTISVPKITSNDKQVAQVAMASVVPNRQVNII